MHYPLPQLLEGRPRRRPPPLQAVLTLHSGAPLYPVDAAPLVRSVYQLGAAGMKFGPLEATPAAPMELNVALTAAIPKMFAWIAQPVVKQIEPVGTRAVARMSTA